MTNNQLLRKAFVCLAIVVLSLTFLVAGPAQTHAASASSGGKRMPNIVYDHYGPIRNVANQNYCLGIKNASTTEGAATIIWACNGNSDQSWELQYAGTDSGGTYYNIINQNSHQCMGVNGSTVQGAKTLQWDCNGNSDQHWYATGTDYTSLVPRSGLALCLGVDGNVVSGASPWLWGCNGHSDQGWH